MDWTHVIAQAKARNNLTQPQLAVIAGCSQACISHLERGKTLDPRYSVGSKLIELASGGLSHQHLARKPRRQPSQASATAPTTTRETSHA